MTVTYRDTRDRLGTGTFRDTSRVLSRPVPPVSGTNVPKVPSRPKCPASSVHRRASDREANREREYEARNSPRRPTEMPRISVRAGRVRDGLTVATAPVLVPCDTPLVAGAAKRKAMPKGAKIALRALDEAIDEVGNLMPASNHIPARTKTCYLRTVAHLCLSPRHQHLRRAASAATGI